VLICTRSDEITEQGGFFCLHLVVIGVKGMPKKSYRRIANLLFFPLLKGLKETHSRKNMTRISNDLGHKNLAERAKSKGFKFALLLNYCS